MKAVPLVPNDPGLRSLSMFVCEHRARLIGHSNLSILFWPHHHQDRSVHIACHYRWKCRDIARDLSIYGQYIARGRYIGHIRPMFETAVELMADLGRRVKSRRVALGITQAAAAERAGVSYRTWRRMERDGKASIEDLSRAAIALRCEEGLKSLFPAPAAASMDELLRHQERAAQNKHRVRAPSLKRSV